MALSATIMHNVLEYICESLHLHMSVHLYKQTLNWPNITYMVKQIKQRRFKKLDVLVPQAGGGILDIPKTIIFIDKIEDRLKMAKYF